MTDSQITLLQNTFPGLETEAAKELLSHVKEVVYPAGATLCKEGAQEYTFYILADGQVVITQWIEFSQEERILRYSEKGDFFGEMAIIHDMPRATTVRTTQESTVLEMERADFMNVISNHPSIALTMVRTTMDRMRENDHHRYAELQETYTALQRLDQTKLDFIEVAAHELRTPLTVIQGYAKMLNISIQDQNLLEAIEGMNEGVGRMLAVVNAMLDVTKIDSEALKIAPAPVLPKLLAKEALQTFHDAIQKRQIEVIESHETSEKLPFIYADPVLLKKLFYQLVSNAIKYTPDGGRVEIYTRETHDSRVGHGLHIEIKDSGIGIKDEHLQQIFDKFFQGGDVSLHSSSKTAFMGGGPGLGLAIANGIVKAHNGEIWVQSDGFDVKSFPGTSFHILLPANTPS